MNIDHPLLVRTKPPVEKHQAAVLAARLFNLHITDLSFVKELNSYDDRNFYMRGSLNGQRECQEYVLKIINDVESRHEYFLELQCNIMLFLQTRGYNCSSPVLSILKTHLVRCKIPRKHRAGILHAEPGHVSMVTDKDTNGISLENGTSTLSVTSLRNIVDGIEIYDGEEYSEDEFLVCAVLLLNFVPGKLLNEIPLNTQLLLNAGVAVGSMDRDLKDFVGEELKRPEFSWDLSNVDEKIEPCLEAVTDPHHVEMVREVCEAFRKTVKPKLHLLPKQIIHGDPNYTNLVFSPRNKHCSQYSVQDIGVIDFGDLNYSCTVFEIAISLMYILNLEGVLKCGRTQMAGHFFAGYSSVHPLSSEELEVLPVLVASRFCQSLVFGAYVSKLVDPGNEYILETAKNGWENLEEFWKTPKEEVLQLWMEMSENTRQNQDEL